eukprot:TRINITY_DN66857_c0_g3_i1.p1 TRINITY_DN66857_c0_g3~~TRINITY_DN66857_c0_g3_i1.p1  ORF type:complete len:239 (-),score=17.15 TRINITY_DN66857_c0_g3_i1:367-999(-)
MDIGAFYTDPNHYQPGSFAGTRMISDENGDTAGSRLTLVGSDDGFSFWTLYGNFTNKKTGALVVDFSPKGGPANLNGTYNGKGKLTWQDGNFWSAVKKPTFTLGSPMWVLSDLGGFYTDPNHYKPGTFAGTRMISDKTGNRPGMGLTLVGSDDGKLFWTLHGEFTNKTSGALTVDFSPKGGPSDLTGTFAKGKITWQDGNKWVRKNVTLA